MTKRQVISPKTRQALYENHSYSAAIRAGDLLFVSGQVGSLEDGTPEPDFAKQVQLAFDNLTAVLEAAGCTLDDVVDVTTFHTDLKGQFKTVQPIRKRAFGNGPLPNWTAVGVNFLSGFDFEIKVIARIPGSN
ncbi:RidA family protein [Paraburkholderia sp. LEh10]|uniref:RidA family protein n=1 Tax=Paraburkholderia sp. LEh10 TaxID=2821353 RepID=UPI001AE6F2AA|nr:RidA family protein [Paraburkholderia sp. LEh10]MBP0596213.1 RidA family protein [Paraburkholderia sp. LEh10]